MRAWAEKKTDDREEWAREVWWAVHINGSEGSTASMAIHAFSREIQAHIMKSPAVMIRTSVYPQVA